VQGSQNGRFVNLHNLLKLQFTKTQQNTKLQKNKQNNFFKLNKIVASLAVFS